MNLKIILLSLFTIAVGIASGLIPADLEGADPFVFGLIPFKGACEGLLLALPVFFAGRALSLPFSGKPLKVLLLVTAFAFVGSYFGNYVRDGAKGLNLPQAVQGATSERGLAGFKSYMEWNLKETVILEKYTQDVKYHFGSFGTKVFFLIDLVLCAFFFFLVGSLAFYFFPYCERCLRYKQKAGKIKISYLQADSQRFIAEMEKVLGSVKEANYSKTIAFLGEMKRALNKNPISQEPPKKENKKTPLLELTVSEVRCPLCQEGTLRGSVMGRDAKGNWSGMRDLDFEITSKPHESPSGLSAQVV